MIAHDVPIEQGSFNWKVGIVRYPSLSQGWMYDPNRERTTANLAIRAMPVSPLSTIEPGDLYHLVDQLSQRDRGWAKSI